MNRHNDRKTNVEVDAEAKRLRSIFEAASNPAPPLVAPPYFAARIRALSRDTGKSAPRTPVALAAVRLLPVFAVVALLLVGAAGYESSVLTGEREAAVAQALARNGGSDAVLGAVLLASPVEKATGGSQ